MKLKLATGTLILFLDTFPVDTCPQDKDVQTLVIIDEYIAIENDKADDYVEHGLKKLFSQELPLPDNFKYI